MATYKSYQGHHLLSRGLFWGKLTGFWHKEVSFGFIHKFFYNFWWAPWRIVLIFFLHLQVNSKEDLEKLGGPLIVVANHMCWADPFIIGASFPFLAKIFPIRYACLWKYFYIPFFLPFVWAFGGFPVWRGVGLSKALRKPLKILEKEGVVGIFPEGKRRWKKGLRRPKRGAAFMAIKTGAKILPVKIEAPAKMKLSKILLRKYKVKVKIGIPFSLTPQPTEPPELLNQPANYIMQKVNEL